MAEVFVAGVAMTRFGLRSPTVADLAYEAARGAMADADVDPAGVRAVFASCSGDAPTPGGDALSMRLALRRCGLGRGDDRPAAYACASGARALYLAWRAVEAELYDVVLCVGAGQSAAAATDRADGAAPRRVEAARRYMAASGATVEHLACTVAKNRRHGGLNPAAPGAAPAAARDRDVVAAPLTRAMLAVRSAGAAAVVLSSRRRFARTPRIRASVLASDGGRNGDVAAAFLYQAAGLGPDDVDCAEVHDDTAAAELAAYEALDLIPAGHGGELIESGFTELGGVLPVNTSGGLLSLGEVAGASGIAQVCELAWQLRGRAGARQVPGAHVGLAHSVEEAGGDAPAVVLTLLTTS